MSFEIPFKSGSAGVFVVTPGTASGSIETSGTIGPGVFVTLTPPEGKRVKLFTLAGKSGTFTGFRLKAGGVDVSTATNLSRGDQGADGFYAIGQGAGSDGAYTGAETMDPMIFEPDVVVTFSLDASTSTTLTYNYACGTLL